MSTLSFADRLSSIRLTDVRLTDAFWSPRIETNRSVTIPFALARCEETGRIDNFAKAGRLIPHPARRRAEKCGADGEGYLNALKAALPAESAPKD